jgi:hypothetical protein
MIISLTKTHDIPALVLQAGGTLARRTEEMSEAECESWASNVVRDIFGVKTQAPSSVERTQWSRDQFSLGSYAYVAVGSKPDDIAALAEPLSDRLYFAGEATYRYHWTGAHGAFASGIREAARILDDPAVLVPRVHGEPPLARHDDAGDASLQCVCLSRWVSTRSRRAWRCSRTGTFSPRSRPTSCACWRRCSSR